MRSLAVLFLSLFALISVAAADPARAADMCAYQTARLERAEGIPQGLLTAISHAESGRWDAKKQASFAWPWTVTSGGPGRYYPSKAEALAEVRRLQAAGRTNIDVGCMQINLHYHGEAFESLEQAFDPAANVRYAADFLKRLFAESGSWETAASHYHSRTRARAEAYGRKVAGLWDDIKDDQRVEVPSAENAYSPRVVDHAWTNRLNARRKMRLAEARGQVVADAEVRRLHQLNDWRNNRALAGSVQASAARNRALAEKRRAEELAARNTGPARSPDEAAAFAERRRGQLQAWRQGKSGVWSR